MLELLIVGKLFRVIKEGVDADAITKYGSELLCPSVTSLTSEAELSLSTVGSIVTGNRTSSPFIHSASTVTVKIYLLPLPVSV